MVFLNYSVIRGRQILTRLGVYVCHCGLNIAGVVDSKSVAEYASKLPNVKVARDNTYLCSDAGQKIIKEDIEKHRLNRIVVASCSPRMHEETFRKAISEAGLNPYLLEMINIREQDSWVHTNEPEKATEKAQALLAMAVARASRLEPLKRGKIKAKKSVLVIGGGIAGIQAALDLANDGFKVSLVEKSPSIGGRMAQLDKTFPTLDCSACILTPKMAEVGRHPNVELLAYAEVENVNGFVGNYEVTIRKKPRYVDKDQCTGCSECEKVCPVSMPSEFDLGLNTRKAVYRPFPQAVPNVFTIDKKGTPPCRVACPAGVNVQGYVALASQNKFKEAYELIKKFIPFPSVCGRVCFHPCENECERGKLDEPVAINAIKRFVADYVLGQERESQKPIPKEFPERVAIIGSGPAGLAAAYELTSMGYQVTVFESLPKPGGMLRVGIPEYRLPKSTLEEEIHLIRSIGVEIRTNVTIGKDLTLDELQQQGYQAIFFAVGVQKARKLRIAGEELNGVISAIDYLKHRNLNIPIKIGHKVAVIGGGNVAIDAARSALRHKAKEVTVLYRRSRAEMPAYPVEVEEAEKEGIKLRFLISPVRILGDNENTVALECIKMVLGEPDKTGRRRPIPIDGSEFIIEVDTVISAIGQALDTTPLPRNLKLSQNGTISVDPITFQTNLSGIFAGGDAVRGEATVIDAIAHGKKAAVSIHRFLRGLDLHAGREEVVSEVGEVPIEGIKKSPRQVMPLLSLDQRASDKEVSLGFTEEMVLEEANRCLACGGCSECLECEKVCELAGVVNHQQKEELVTREVGGIIVAVGCEVFDASLTPELGYERYKNVISNLEFERLSNAAGPSGGKVLCPTTGKPPKSVAFIQCVGSRDKRFCKHCCRIGCMVTLKQAILLKEKLGHDVDVYICYNDMRAFGKAYEEFYDRARHMDIKFVKGFPSEVKRNPDNSLHFDVFESNTSKLLEIQADIVVLSSGLVSSPDFGELQKILRIPRSPDGFFLETHPKLRPLETPTRGIFLAGTCQSPKDIPDTVSQASGAAMKAAELLATGEVEIEPLIAVIDENLCSGCRICESVCPYQAINMEDKTMEGKEKSTAKILEAVCQGCGACSVACPTGAIDMQHYRQEQILDQIVAAIQGGKRE
ncbi:MAG: FAD-dependent oxidoreductase [Candidatus Bathyarchaeota archaeon]|nr:MAG: FAD-dependent oxidoreductase [Candidatus Bathyarchaeota archaeon]